LSRCGVLPLALGAFSLVSPASTPAGQAPAHAAPGEIRVRAESYEQTSPGHVEARGLVDMTVADLRVQADRADVREDRRPDGSVRRLIVAEGNVVLIRGEERLCGDRLELDDSGTGTLLNAVGYLEPGVFVQARRIERLDADSYRVFGGTFSSCSQSNPRWSFSASRARVEVDDKITARDAIFLVKGVPAFYTPFVSYPIRKDQRSTGFLLPSFGYSEHRGYELTTGFYWAMGRSADQTFWLDYYSKAGYGLGHELRWVGAEGSDWTLRSLLFDGKGQGKLDYSLDGRGRQQLPGMLRASANVHLSSSMAFAQQYQGASVRSVRASDWSASLDRDFGLAALSAYSRAAEGGRDGRLPGLSLWRFPRAFWGGLVFGLQASADRVLFGARSQPASWTQYELAPTLSRPLRLSFLEVDPSLGYRYKRYGSRILLDEKGSPRHDEHGELERERRPIERSFFESSLEMRGPTFARVFDTPGLGYSDRFKHTIGPELKWTHATPVADFAGTPPSGVPDRLASASTIEYALVQRLYAKRRGPSGTAMPYELLSWRLTQPYYVRPATDRSQGLGPIQSSLTLQPTPEYQLDSQLEYDTSQRRLRSTRVSVSARRPGLSLQASWTRSLNGSGGLATPAAVVGPLRARSETLAGSGAAVLVPNRLTFEGALDYDVAQRQLWQVRGLVRYSTQCCGFTVEHNWRRSATGSPDAQWRFSVELAHVGSIGFSPGGIFGPGGF
jgi:LPS-assembly protein